MKKIIFLALLLIGFSAFGQDKNKDDIKAPPLPCTTPTTQANNFTATASGANSIDLSWTRGDGDNVIVLAHEAAAVDADPVSGNSYTANSTFGSGDQIGTGNYVVYSGSGTSLTVTGLNSNTAYYFAVYEFYNTDYCYLTPGATANANTDAAPPTVNSVSPDNFFADKGKQITISGSDLSGATVTLGGVNGTIVSNDGSTLVVDFPAGYYTNNTLTVSTGVNPDATYTVTVNTRNVIPVGGGTDYHTTIQSALDGLYAWYGTTTFDSGQLPGAKTIEVYSGTYTEDVTPNTNLAPTSSYNLIIQNKTGESPVIDATGLTNAFTIGLNYVQIKGFIVHSADDANIDITGTNAVISMVNSYGSVNSAGIILNGATNSSISNCLVTDNYTFGIRLVGSDNAVIKNNTVANNGHESKAPPLPGVYDPAQLYVESGTGVSVQNNIFYSKAGTYVFTLKTEDGITISSDYNTYFKNGNTYLVYYNGTLYSDLAAWSGNGAGANDIESDPDFVNPGTDYHIKSVDGSYAGGAWPPDIANGGTWNNDATTSPALDAGNPSDAYSNEPASGNRINQGAYGNTVQASKSQSCVAPTSQASSFTATSSGTTTIDLSWTRGDGDNVIILAHQGSNVDSDPVSGSSYTANSTFGSGDQIGTANYVVYNSNGASVTVSGLNPNTTYYFEIYEYNNTDNCYLIPGATANATTDAQAPSISSVSPDNFFADKGKQLTITGSAFTGATVTLGGVTGSIVSNDGSTIVVNFPAGYYTDNTLTVSTGVSPDATTTVTVNKRNVIPVGGGTDYHTTIQSALDGLYSWYGTTSFDAGQLPGAKTIEVYNGTYTEDVTPNTNLAPTSSDNLIIRNRLGESPVIDATGLTNAFTVGLNYVQIKGFTVHSANDANIDITGTNAIISLVKTYGSVNSAGILLNGATNSSVSNCLVTDNYTFGIRIISSDNTVIKNNTVANNGHESKAPPLPGGVYDPAQLYVESGTGISVQNNIFYSKSGSYVFTLKTEDGITISSDYNTYFKNGNTYLVYYNSAVYADLAAWNGNGAGANDIESDPDFVNPGTDFHIKSADGSYAGGAWPPDVENGGSWTNDAATSPALDAGNPSDDYSNEPQSGNRINQGAFGNTAQASKSPVTDINWNGNVSTDWQDANNWTPAQVPGSGNNAIIPDGRPNYPVIDDGTTTAVCYNLTIDANASVTIADNGQMTVYGTITNNRGVDGLVIESTSSGDGSLIQNTTGVSATVQRFLPTGGSAQWHFISPAISDASASLFPGLYAYDETQDDWWTGGTYYYNNTSGWTNPPATLNVANGYIYYQNQTTAILQGNLNAAGSYSINAGYTEHSGDAANGDPYTNFDGWTLVGNPYPCALDWEALDKSNDITPTVYYYDDNIHNYAYYQDGGTSLNGGSRYIPMMQGFFVKTNDKVDGGTIIIPANARIHNDQGFWKKSNASSQGYIKLKVSDNNYTDETIIKINNSAQKGYDDYLDAFKQFSWDPEVPQIFSFTPDLHTKLAINNVALTDFRTIVPLGTKFKNSGEKSVEIEENTITDAYLFIKDKQNGTIYSLLGQDSIGFDFSDSIEAGRLQLIIEKNVAPEMSDLQDIIEEQGTDFSFSLPDNFCTDKNTIDKLTYTATLADGKKLPSWLAFDADALIFSGNAPDTGNFEIKITATDLKGATTSTNFKLSVKKSVTEQSDDFYVKVYPVPAVGMISIETGGENESYTAKVISVTGQSMIEKSAKTGGVNKISLLSLQSGTYFLKLTFDDGKVVLKKIILMK